MSVTPAIPAAQIVNIIPSVLSGGGNALDLIGLCLTPNTRVPIGQVLSFPTAATVGQYFGPTSQEAAAATIYFLGFNNSNVKPGLMLFWQYVWETPVSAYLRGGNISAMPLATLQGLTPGTLTIEINGSPVTSSTINFSSATSFSNAASIIATAIGASVTCVYDSVSGAFVISTVTTGATATIAFPTTDALATAIQLTQATGAVISQGAALSSPAVDMAAITNITVNWCTFFTTFEPVASDKEAFASWTNGQGEGAEFVYAMWDTNILNTESGGPSPAVVAITTANYSGTAMIYTNPAIDTLGPGGVPGGQLAAFLAGAIASIDFTETQGTATMAFKSQSGIPAHVTNAAVASYLNGYGLNFYGDYTTPNEAFIFFYGGRISGPFQWIDAYVNEVWLDNQIQLAMMVLLTNVKALPYNTPGDALVEATALDPITQAVNFGAIQPGVALSQAQITEVNSAAGLPIAPIVGSRGWYFQVLPAIAQVRVARSSPPCTLWYTNGGSIQSLNIASIQVQ